MRRQLYLLAVLLCAWCIIQAVPAKPGFRTYTQSDGSQILLELVGDEFFHYFMTQDGLPVERDEHGDFHYIANNAVTTMMAHNPHDRTTAEQKFIKEQREKLVAQKPPQVMPRRFGARPHKVGEPLVPTMGSPRVPILLVQYADKQMANSKEQFEAHYKTDPKSVLQYFTDQSNGKYTPQFDIYGIYDLPEVRATYGHNQNQRKDAGVAWMVCDAIDAAGDDVDWSLYDNDGDGQADVCIVVYAGVGEARSGMGNAVWPCKWMLSDAVNFDDGRGVQTRNGVTIDLFAVFNELSGSNDNGTVMDGIGVFCHEFSHCLGLPDFYETTYNHGYYGMGNWSLMNAGCYNGVAIEGDTPIGYSGYEKAFMGWIDLLEPTLNTHYTLPVFNSGSIDHDQAIKITSDLNENEYFILENRRKQGWDQCIASEGVLITHFTYVPERWEGNTINNLPMQLATIIPADNIAVTYNEYGDLYGPVNHEFSLDSHPAMVLNMNADGTLAEATGGAGSLNKPVTDIILNEDGTASLWYIKTDLTVNCDSMALVTPMGSQKSASFTVIGQNLPHNVTLTLNDGDGVFAIDKNIITPEQAKAGAEVTVTFSPQEIANYSATITIICENIDTLTISLAGEGLIESELPVMLPADTTQVTATSFRAEWTDGSPSGNVKNYTLYVNYVKPITGPQLLENADFTQLEAVMEQGAYSQTYKNVANEAVDYLPEGWTCGNLLYVANGAIIMGSDVTTKSYTLPRGYDQISTVIKAKTYMSIFGNSTIQLLNTSGSVSEVITTTDEEADYTLVLDANACDAITFAASRYPMVSSIKIYAGDVTTQTNAPLLARVEQNDSITFVFEGITDKHYVVKNLLPGGTYDYWVETVYINNTHSEISNVETVTLLQPTLGDVTGDGQVDIADVNAVINVMLGKIATSDELQATSDLNGDGQVDIADVNAVINILLGK